MKFSPLPEIPRAPLRAGFFPHGRSRRRFGGSPAAIRRRENGADRRGKGAAGAQREGTKRCESAAGIESHGIDQKPERQESARTGDRCASALAFFVFRLVTRPLCRYSSFLPFPSGLRALPRRPGHEPELPPCLRRRPALDARGIDVDAVGRHGPNRTHFPDAHGGVRAAAGLISSCGGPGCHARVAVCAGYHNRRISMAKKKAPGGTAGKGGDSPAPTRDGADCSGAAHHGPH